MYLVLFIVGLIDIYKNKKLFGSYLIFAFILFANPLSYRIFGSVVQQVVYHRIFNLICPGLISIIGFAALINYFDNKYQFRNYKYAYAVLVPLVLFFPKRSTSTLESTTTVLSLNSLLNRIAGSAIL